MMFYLITFKSYCINYIRRTLIFFTFFDVIILLFLIGLSYILFYYLDFISLILFPELFIFLALFLVLLYLLWYLTLFYNCFTSGSYFYLKNIKYKGSSASDHFCMGLIYILAYGLLLYFYLLYTSCINSWSAFLLYGSFFNDNVTLIMKTLIILCSIFVVYLQKLIYAATKPEFFLVLGFSILALLCIISSYDFLFLLLSLELFSMSIYILFSFHAGEKLIIDAAIKYFFMSIFSSFVFLFSVVFIYSYFGTLYFSDIALLCLFPFSSLLHYNLWVIYSVLFLSILLKLAVVPLHLWVIDVYEKAPIIVMIYLIICGKISIFYLLCILSSTICISHYYLFNVLFLILSLYTMFVGSLLALAETKLKRFLIYSSVVNTGILLFSLSNTSLAGILAFFIYIVFYNITFLIFVLYMYTFRLLNFYVGRGSVYRSKLITYLYDVTLISTFYERFLITLFILSFAGIPPLLGFYLKYIVLLSHFDSINYFTAFFFLVITTMSAYYYLRLLKLLWFNQLLPKRGSYHFSTALSSSFFFSFVVNFWCLIILFFSCFIESFLLISYYFISASLF